MAQKTQFISQDRDWGIRLEEPSTASISEPRLPSREDDEEQRRRDIRTGLAAPSSPSSIGPSESQSFLSRIPSVSQVRSSLPPGSVQRQLLSATQLPLDADLGSLMRFGKAAVVDPVKGLWDLGWQTAEDPKGTVGEIWKGIISPDPYMEQWGKARSAIGRGEIPQAIGHGIAGSVPLVGPSVAGTIERAGETGDTATAMGELAQFALPGPKGLRFKPRLRSQLLTVSERSGRGVRGAATGWGEGVLERTLAGAPTFRSFRRRQHAEMSGHADDLMKSLDPRTISLEEVGQNLIDSIKRVRDRRNTTGNKLYEDVFRLSTDIPISTAPIKVVAKEVKRELMLGGKIVKDSPTAGALALVNKILKSPKSDTLQDIHKARSVILALSRKFRTEGMPGQNVRAFDRLANAMDDAIGLSAKASGDPGLYTAWRAAQDYYKATKGQIDTAFVRGLLKLSDDLGTGAEKVAGVIARAEAGNVRRLWDVVPKNERNSVRAALVKDYLEKAGTGELGSVPATGVRGALEKVVEFSTVPRQRFDRELSGTALRVAMEKAGAERLQVVLGQETADNLLRIAEDAARIGSKGIDVAPGLVAAGMNAMMMKPLLNPLSIPISGSTAVLMSGSVAALSWMLVRQPASIPLYKKFLSLITRRDVRGAAAVGIQLEKMMEVEETRLQQEEKRKRSSAKLSRQIQEPRTPEEQAAVRWFQENPGSFAPEIRVPPRTSGGPRTGPMGQASIDSPRR